MKRQTPCILGTLQRMQGVYEKNFRLKLVLSADDAMKSADTMLRNLKPRDKLYKVNDREGLYVAVTAAGAVSF